MSSREKENEAISLDAETGILSIDEEKFGL